MGDHDGLPAAADKEAISGEAIASKVILSVGVQSAISVALHVNVVPVITELQIVNGSGEALDDVTIDLVSNPPAIHQKSWRLSEVGIGQVRQLSDLDVELDGPWLSSLTEGVPGVVTFTARRASQLLAEASQAIRFLAHNEWGGNASIPDLLAAFVEPNDPAVPGILRKASELLREAGKSDALEGHQATSKGRLWEQTAAIWSAVCALDIRYVNPPPSFEQTGQRIRPPRQILKDGVATCLDLTVLFAACLEHIGLRPLIVLTKGHAFPGVWLSRHDFRTSVADDAASLRNRLALHDVLLFESTLCSKSPAPGFSRACALGGENVSAKNDADFEAVIDIHRARQRRIRPLGAPIGPSVAYAFAPGAGGLDATPPAPPVVENPPALRDDDAPDNSDAPPTTPEGRLERWRKRLLDLSGRNRLVNLRVEGKQVLAIDCPDPAGLEDMLAKMREGAVSRPITLRPWPDLMSGADPRSAAIHRDRMNENAQIEFARQAFARRELLVARGEDQLQASLTEIFRAAKSAQQEGGSNTLYLTIGALLWRAKGKDKPSRAPLILVPVILHRDSVRSAFQLRSHDDEPRLNTTLLELLRQDYDVRIPEIEETVPEDGSGLDVNKILEIFRLKLREIPGWEVTDEVALTNLSFTKYLMWKDLAGSADRLRQNVVARRLMDGPEKEASEAESPMPTAAATVSSGAFNRSGGALDDEPEFAGLACPMEADSSQLSAVAAAARGDSFVLIGPPGTGKSQTITNIIANTLAQGRTVLFVAEKRAALEVVHRRLSGKEVDLGDFCLDLFSAKASKTAVLDQLDRAQQAREYYDAADWIASRERIAEARAELNGYVRELHRKGRNGWTPYRAIGVILRAGAAGVPEIRLEWASLDAHDAAGYQRLVQSVEDAAVTLNALGDVASCAALIGVEKTDWSPSWQANIIEVSSAAASVLGILRKSTGAVLRTLTLPTRMPLTRRAIDAMDHLALLLIDPAAPEAAWALGDAEDTCEALYAAEALASEHTALTANLKGSWRPSVSTLPLEKLLADWREASGKWMLARRSGHRTVRQRLADAAVEVPEDPTDDLVTLIEIQTKEAEFRKLAAEVAPILGRLWRGFQTDFKRLEQAIALASKIRAACAACAPDAPALLALRDHVRRLLADGADLLGDAGAIGRPLRRFREVYFGVAQALQALGPLCGRDVGSLVSEDDDDWAGALEAHLRGWGDSSANLRNWCAWRRTFLVGETLGLTPLFKALEAGSVGFKEAAGVFEANYARWWVNRFVEDLPRLRTFVAAEHEHKIDRFRALDVEIRRLATKVVRGRLAESLPGALERQRSPEYAVLTREVAKRQRHLPVRQLFARMPKAIRKLAPCVMMSPLSVAQYLPSDAETFDLVIFDEASQIATWDAIGAVGRGRQVIVVGDPRQLPPTNFFQRQVADEGVTAGSDRTIIEIEDLESVLDECLGAGIPRIELTWHYRSRHESLIAFSNRQYYGGNLITFPSPVVRDAAVSFRYVVDGIYARGGGRTNIMEAQAVVSETVRLLRVGGTYGQEKSIGIVTFNAEQQALVENLLEKERAADPSLERFFLEEQNPEAVLIKNLEGVQGEERDVVLFSLTYGPDPTGRLAMNFGPLNQSGGERRLNVAITRAREALVVFGSIRPEQIDLSRTSAAGVAHLKLFLSFAEHGARAFGTAPRGSLGDFESHFEAVVAGHLSARGWTLHSQIGVSAFRIDLGVVDPNAPGSFLAGLECDGATYHRSASARDRDRLRQAVLEGLGWKILRVWSTDWWMNAPREVERLHQALTKLLQESAERDAGRLAADGPAIAGDIAEEPPVAAGANDGNKPAHAPPDSDLSAEFVGYAEAESPVLPAPTAPEVTKDAEERLAGPSGYNDANKSDPSTVPPEVLNALDADAFHEEHYRPRLAALVDAILRAEAPMRDDHLSQRVARAHGFQRTGRLIKEASLRVLPGSCSTTREGATQFIWPPGVSPRSWSTFRRPSAGQQVDPGDVPLEELAILAREALEQADGDEENALLLMRDACGLGRLREATRLRCIEALDRVRTR